MILLVIKRNGKKVEFDPKRIYRAIEKASICAEETIDREFNIDIEELIDYIKDNYSEVSVETIQDLVIEMLMKSKYTKTAKRYIIYRDSREKARKAENNLLKTYNEIIEVEDGDIKNDNANINGNIPAGQAMKIFSLHSKKYALNYLIKPMISRMHKSGDFHIHDLDFYATKTTNCLHTDLLKIFKNGIKAIEGDSRIPKRIESCKELASISVQSSQNEQFGGQSIANFDYAFALGVRRTIVDELKSLIEDRGIDIGDNLSDLAEYAENNSLLDDKGIEKIVEKIELFGLDKITLYALLRRVEKAVKQSMEGFVHNSVMAHSRGGGQVVFLSVNVGTDYSPEGRMVTRSLLEAIYNGVGKKGRTAIFPIVVFKVKDGVSFSEEDYELFKNNYADAINGKLKYKTPNFDLFVYSLKVMAKRHFPTYIFLDSTFNKSKKWDIEDSNRWKYEASTMGW